MTFVEQAGEKTPNDSRTPKPGYQWKIGIQICCCTKNIDPFYEVLFGCLKRDIDVLILNREEWVLE